MKRTLIHSAQVVVTMDKARREIPDGAIAIEDNQIHWVGPTAGIPPEWQGINRGQSSDNARTADWELEVIDATGHIVLPGFVNTHHHFFQTLTRAIPGAQNATLFNWLKTLYPIWAELTPPDIHLSTQLALSELLLSGCTTSSDHHYLWPNGCRLDDQFQAAEAVGVRFHGARGSMSVGESAGGLPPDRVTEAETQILQDSRRVVETYHDAARFAMRRVIIAPCSPFTVSPELMRASAELARSFGPQANVHLHTHLAETLDENEYCLARFGMRPGAFAESLEWLGDDVWHAHCVHLNQEEVNQFGATSTGVAHCPTSNMRLASGIAPIQALLQTGSPLGLGVDGSASNDGSHLLAEARQAMLLQRVQGNPAALTARQVLEMATLGGAAVLGRDDIGALVPGMAADLVAFDLTHPTYAGAAVHDAVAALVFCQPQQVDFAFINGQQVVAGGQLLTLDLPQVVHNHNLAAKNLLIRAGLA